MLPSVSFTHIFHKYSIKLPNNSSDSEKIAAKLTIWDLQHENNNNLKQIKILTRDCRRYHPASSRRSAHRECHWHGEFGKRDKHQPKPIIIGRLFYKLIYKAKTTENKYNWKQICRDLLIESSL